MTATIIQLRPAPRAPEQLSLADELRRLADQIEAGTVAGLSIIATARDGTVRTINPPII